MPRSHWKAALAMGASIALMVAPSAAAGDDDVERSGGCSGRASWELKLSPDDSGLEVEFEVDQNLNGRRWRVVMKHNGDRFFSDVRTTGGPSGSFSVERRVRDLAGADSITARARALSGDQACRGRATI